MSLSPPHCTHETEISVFITDRETEIFTQAHVCVCEGAGARRRRRHKKEEEDLFVLNYYRADAHEYYRADAHEQTHAHWVT